MGKSLIIIISFKILIYLQVAFIEIENALENRIAASMGLRQMTGLSFHEDFT